MSKWKAMGLICRSRNHQPVVREHEIIQKEYDWLVKCDVLFQSVFFEKFLSISIFAQFNFSTIFTDEIGEKERDFTPLKWYFSIS